MNATSSISRPASRQVLKTTGEAAPDPSRLLVLKALFLVAGGLSLTPWLSPPSALALGAVLALTFENPFQQIGKSISSKLLQGSVVLLGFAMDLPVVLKTGIQGAGLAAVTIAATLGLGWLLGRQLGIEQKVSSLISAGTAICGGSAIAAVGSVIGVAEGEISVALGTVFILNAAALYIFPPIGHALGLSQTQFGTWAGIAIHDISSVVGASAHFGLGALQIATAVKLSRALWIIPVVLGTIVLFKSQGNVGGGSRRRLYIPWFIGLFLIASVIRSFVPGVPEVAPFLAKAATSGLTLALFLIGGSLSLKTLRAVGWRPFLQGALLWLFISGVSLAFVVRFL
jgi:uncharacterized integral membrane protein (TIGR00698 family)